VVLAPPVLPRPTVRVWLLHRRVWSLSLPGSLVVLQQRTLQLRPLHARRLLHIQAKNLHPRHSRRCVGVKTTTRPDPHEYTAHLSAVDLGPDLQNILRQSYDYLTIMPKLRSTYDKRLIYKTSYEELMAFLRHDLLAKL